MKVDPDKCFHVFEGIRGHILSDSKQYKCRKCGAFKVYDRLGWKETFYFHNKKKIILERRKEINYEKS